jgi:ABC-2 type transport system ATP-binding protein
VEVAAADLPSLKAALSGLNAVTSLREELPFLELTLAPDFSAAQLNQWLYEQGQILHHLKVRKKSLEAEFLERTS